MSEETVEALPAQDPEPGVQLPTHIDELDHLKIENLIVKIQNVALQTTQLQTDLQKAVKMRQDLQGQLEALRNDLAMKYSIKDFSQVHIDPETRAITRKGE